MYRLRLVRRVGTLAEQRLSNLRFPVETNAIKVPKKQELLDPTTNPLAALENALKIGSPLDIHNLYGVVKPGTVPERTASHILRRVGNDQMSFLGGLKAFEFALKVRQDYIASGKVPTLEMEINVIKAGKSVAYNTVHTVLQHVQKVLDSPVCNAPGAKEKILNLLFAFKFELAQLEYLFAKMVEKKLDVGETFLGMMRAYAKHDQIPKAEKIYTQMLQQSLPVTSQHTLSLVEGFALQGDIVQARKYASKLRKEPEIEQQALKFLIQCFAQRGLTSDAIQIYKEYRRKGYPTSAYIYEQMIKACISTTDTKGILKFFHKTNGYKSMGMYTQLIKGLFYAGNNVTAWRSIREALVGYTDRIRTRRVHIPSEMVEVIVNDIQGKHMDYLNDMFRLVNLPLEHKTQLVSKMIYFSDVELATILYGQFEKGICKLAQTPIQATINYMLVLSQDPKNYPKVKELFDKNVDISYNREVDMYAALLKGTQDPVEIQKIFKEFEDNGLKINGDMVESLSKGIGERIKELVKEGKVPVSKPGLDMELIPLTF